MAEPGSVERGRIVRERLLAAACELIPEVGWAGVSTRVLAARAGVAPGVVHYHFHGMQALLREAAVTAVRAAMEQGLAVVTASRTAREGLDLMLAALDVHTGTDPTSLLFSETFLAATRDDVLRADLTDTLVHFRAALAEWLRHVGQPEPVATAAVVAAAVDGVMLHRALDPGLTSSVVGPVLVRLVVGGSTARGTGKATP